MISPIPRWHWICRKTLKDLKCFWVFWVQFSISCNEVISLNTDQILCEFNWNNYFHLGINFIIILTVPAEIRERAVERSTKIFLFPIQNSEDFKNRTHSKMTGSYPSRWMAGKCPREIHERSQRRNVMSKCCRMYSSLIHYLMDSS